MNTFDYQKWTTETATAETAVRTEMAKDNTDRESFEKAFTNLENHLCAFAMVEDKPESLPYLEMFEELHAIYEDADAMNWKLTRAASRRKEDDSTRNIFVNVFCKAAADMMEEKRTANN